jgi:hypothetical protein
MREVLPGVFHWTEVHPSIQIEVSEAVKRGLRAAYRRLLALDFDHVIFAHGQPWIRGGKQALRELVEGGAS